MYNTIKVKRRSRIHPFARICHKKEYVYKKAMQVFEETHRNYYNAFRELAT